MEILCEKLVKRIRFAYVSKRRLLCYPVPRLRAPTSRPVRKRCIDASRNLEVACFAGFGSVSDAHNCLMHHRNQSFSNSSLCFINIEHGLRHPYVSSILSVVEKMREIEREDGQSPSLFTMEDTEG